jgi:hypothetical protein
MIEQGEIGESPRFECTSRQRSDGGLRGVKTRPRGQAEGAGGGFEDGPLLPMIDGGAFFGRQSERSALRFGAAWSPFFANLVSLVWRARAA